MAKTLIMRAGGCGMDDTRTARGRGAEAGAVAAPALPDHRWGRAFDPVAYEDDDDDFDDDDAAFGEGEEGDAQEGDEGFDGDDDEFLDDEDEDDLDDDADEDDDDDDDDDL
jgi:hypothetical protein